MTIDRGRTHWRSAKHGRSGRRVVERRSMAMQPTRRTAHCQQANGPRLHMKVAIIAYHRLATAAWHSQPGIASVVPYKLRKQRVPGTATVEFHGMRPKSGSRSTRGTVKALAWHHGKGTEQWCIQVEQTPHGKSVDRPGTPTSRRCT